MFPLPNTFLIFNDGKSLKYDLSQKEVSVLLLQKTVTVTSWLETPSSVKESRVNPANKICLDNKARAIILAPVKTRVTCQ